MGRAHTDELAHSNDLARSLRSLGNLYLFTTNHRRQAEETLLTAREIYDRLPGDYLRQPNVQFEHAMVLLSLAKLYAHTNRPEPHRAASQAAIDLFEALMRDRAGNPDYVLRLTDALNELGESYRCLGRPDLAQATLTRAMRSSEELARSHPTNGYYRHLVADAAYSLASLNYHERHQPAEARVLLDQALEIEQELAIRFPGVGEYMFYVNNLLRDLRDWFGDTARLEALLGRYTASIREHEARYPPEKRDRVRLGRYYLFRGFLKQLLGRYSDAFSDYEPDHFLRDRMLTFIQVQRREYDQAESTAMALAREGDMGSGGGFYNVAQVCAYMAAVVRNDRSLVAGRREELGERYGRQAVQWLEESPIARVSFDTEHPLSPGR